MQRYAILKDHLEQITRAARRYREHASRDPEWVVQWTGEFDPELREIQQLMTRAIALELDPEEREKVLEDFLDNGTSTPQYATGLSQGVMREEHDELLLQKVRLELLIARHDHAALRDALLTHATDWLQSDAAMLREDLAPPDAMRWVAQGLFWTARRLDDLEVVLGVLGAPLFFAALAQWLVEKELMKHVQEVGRHPFLRAQEEAAVRWLEGLHASASASVERALGGDDEDFGTAKRDDEIGELEEVMSLLDQGYALALGEVRGEVPSATHALEALLHEGYRRHEGAFDFGIDHVLRCALESLESLARQELDAQQLTLVEPATKDSVYLWLLATEGHWQNVVRLFTLHAEQVRPLLLDRLAETSRDFDALSMRVRMVHALRQMTHDQALSDALWSLREDPMAPVRHTVWYELVRMGREGMVEALKERILSQDDPLEQEEMLFVLASDSSMKAKETLEELARTSTLKDVDSYTFEEALREWRRGRQAGER